MHKIIKYSTVALALIFMGCSQSIPQIPPTGEINQSQTPYSQIREDVNNMLIVFYGRPINILVDAIENRTKEQAELPTDISVIVNTSFNEIGVYVTTRVMNEPFKRAIIRYKKLMG